MQHCSPRNSGIVVKGKNILVFQHTDCLYKANAKIEVCQYLVCIARDLPKNLKAPKVNCLDMPFP